MKRFVLWTLVICAACGAPAEERQTLPAHDPIADIEPALLFQQGEALAQEGDLVRAEQYMSTAIDRGYSPERGLPILVRVCVTGSRIRPALEYVTPYLRQHPSNWALRYLVASLQLALRHPDIARDELELVIQTAPNQPDPHFLLAVVLADEFHDGAAALPHFARYVQLAPNGPHAEEARARVASHGTVAPAPIRDESVPQETGDAP